MDINRYRYFATVAEMRNFTKAAEALHISQPALTKAIRRTEEEVGLRLFDRDTGPIRLTYAGERFLAEVRKILYVQDNLEREMTEIATGRKGKVTIGVPVESASRWLPRILPDFMAAHPDIEIDILEGNSDSFETGMLNGTIDLSIYTLPLGSKELDFQIVEERPIFLVSSGRHPLARGIDPASNGPRTPMYLEPPRLNGEKFLTLTPDRGLYRVAMQILERHGLTVDIVLQMTNNFTVSSLAAAGMGFCITTYGACERMKRIPDLYPVVYTLDDPVFTRKTIVAYRKGNLLSQAAQDFVDLTVSTMATVPQKEVTVQYR